jgi:hypothetical protein
MSLTIGLSHLHPEQQFLFINQFFLQYIEPMSLQLQLEAKHIKTKKRKHLILHNKLTTKKKEGLIGLYPPAK